MAMPAPLHKYVLIVSLCLLPACGGSRVPSTPSAPPERESVSLQGYVASVVPADGTFLFTNDSLDYGLVSPPVTFGGDVQDYEGLLAEFRRGTKLTVTMRFSEWPGPPYFPNTLTVRGEPSTPVKAPRSVDFGFTEDPVPRIILAYHIPVLYILPWTEFRGDGDYKTWDEARQARGVCVAYEGYRHGTYAIYTTRIGVWRARYSGDRCDDRQ